MEYPKITNEEPQNYTTICYQAGAQQGWECPICKRVLAPFCYKWSLSRSRNANNYY